jgi:drug/metabolite transporter (DMT)-like permease
LTTRQTNFLSEGISQMFLSTLAFALANVFVKQVSHIPVMEVVFFRCAIAAVFCLAGLQRAGASFIGANHTYLFLRGFFGTVALALFFLTVQNIPLATAMTFQYLSPIFTAIIAIFFLKESVKAVQWICYALAFSGVLFIGQIDNRVSYFYVMLGIISAFGSGAAYNLVRKLKDDEHPLTIILHFQLVGVVAGFISLFFIWETPAGWDWFYLLLIGVFSQLGQIFLTNALTREKAASVAIIVYSGLIYGITIGWIFYGESQTVWTLFGMLLVVVGVIASIFYSKRQKILEQIESTAA